MGKFWVAGRVQMIPDLLLFPRAEFGMEMAPRVKKNGRRRREQDALPLACLVNLHLVKEGV